MSKWEYLLESDVKLRSLQRRWKQSGRKEHFIEFVRMWARSQASARQYGLDHVSRFEEDFGNIVDYTRRHYRDSMIAMRGRVSKSSSGHYDIHEVVFRYIPPGKKPLLTKPAEAPEMHIRVWYPNEEELRDMIDRYSEGGGRLPPAYSTIGSGRDSLTQAMMGWTSGLMMFKLGGRFVLTDPRMLSLGEQVEDVVEKVFGKDNRIRP